MVPGHVGQVGGPEDGIRERFPLAGVRPDDDRPESVRQHLETLRAPGAASGVEPGDIAEYQEEEKDDSESEGYETARGKVKSAPEGPSEKEIEAHEMTHSSYQSWCPHCVAGKASDDPHKAQQVTPETKAMYQLDFSYITQQMQARQESEIEHGDQGLRDKATKSDVVTIYGIVSTDTSMMAAEVVKSKSVRED